MDVIEKRQLFQVNHTILQMLSDRRYIVDRRELNFSFEEFDSSSVERMATHYDDPSSHIFVFFPEEKKKIGIEVLRKYKERMETEGVSRAIIVVREGITPMAKKKVAEYTPHHIIEIFKRSELLVNITEHRLVPTHELLSETEKTNLLERYRLQDTQLPRILITDPVSRYFGLSKGQVVKITRKSETAGRYVTYRLVV